jgi:ribonuclease BN (tRNA processing enzyme)
MLRSGDTRPSPAPLRSTRGVDILIREVYPSERLRPEPRPGGEWRPEDRRSFHTSDVGLGRLAAEAKPGVLVLTHIARMGGTDAELLAGVREGGSAGEPSSAGAWIASRLAAVGASPNRDPLFGMIP